MKDFKSYDAKEAYVQDVFSSIAKNYDLMNTVLSFNQDSYWRKFAVDQMNIRNGMRIADIACGTGMMSKEALTKYPSLEIEGLDFSEEMLRQGHKRLTALGMIDRVNLTHGDAMDLPYEDNRFDAAMSAFLLRNVPSIPKALDEMKRVVKPGGKVVALDLGKPTMFGFKQAYYLYFEKILPLLGKMSRDNSSYGWLPESLRRYPGQAKVLDMFKEAGFVDATYYELTGGIVAVHVATVPEK